MPEHRIRLRGGWECQYRQGDGDEGPEVVCRIDLPLEPTHVFPSRFRLTRQFGRPPLDDRLEAVRLDLRNVVGLKAARINGSPIAFVWVDDRDASIKFADPLLSRNGLALEFDMADARPEENLPWGEIALVIGPR
jgi:hypothetical protein